MKKILGIILLLSVPLFGQVSGNKTASIDSNAVRSASVETPGIGMVPLGILVGQGVTDTVSIEGSWDETTWYWLQEDDSRYYAGADSSANAGFGFKPVVMSLPFQYYRFTFQDTVTTSGGASFIVPFGRLFN